ncbi:MAG: AAA family ATPase [Deltaproteobacteria bacterium]|nr:AAA family ATPase [Deltaproteobacteria bacterium]
MLKKLYANNYRCLVNFEIDFNELTLLMGPNGGGKSTLFDLLYEIRRLLVGKEALDDKDKRFPLFPLRDLTAWVKKTEQSFELDVQGEDGLFSYKLVIVHNPEAKKRRIEFEHLLLDGKPLFEFNRGEVQLYHDDHGPGSNYPFDWTISALSTIAPRNDNKKLTWFKDWIEKMFIVSLQPKAITSETEEESDWLNRDGTNFPSWYRYISQEHQDKTFQLTKHLRETIAGFHAFKLEQAGTYRILKVGFNSEDQKGHPIYFDFGQISDGQRVMIVLYTLLFGLQGLGHTLFIDEPENYISLPEIQPWLMELKDACGERMPQAVLISHHPELIDYLGPECGKWIERDPLGPARVKKVPEHVDDGLKLSEQIARGWME